MNPSNHSHNQIKMILFDLGGILVPDCEVILNKRIAHHLGLSFEVFMDHRDQFSNKTSSGAMSLRDMYKSLKQDLRLMSDPDEIVAYHLEQYVQTSTVRDTRIIELIRILKKWFLVSCLTNTEIEIAEYNKQNGLFDYFDSAYISTEMGLHKPDPRIFYAVLRDGYTPHEVLFIDDKVENCEAAALIGMRVIHFTGFESSVRKLSKELPKISDSLELITET